jgi:hypothetical protein
MEVVMKKSTFFYLVVSFPLMVASVSAATSVITYTSAKHGAQTINNPAANSCVSDVLAANTPFTNNTGSNIVIFGTGNCTGSPIVTVAPNLILPGAPAGANSFEATP